MKKKQYRLVKHTETAFLWWGIHESIVENGKIYWIGSKAIRKYDSYDSAVLAWGRIEPDAGFIDIMDYEDAEFFFDRLDYSEHEELNFD